MKESINRNIDFKRIFKKIRLNMGIPDNYKPNYGPLAFSFKKQEWKDALVEGIEIKITDEDFKCEKNGLMSYKGERVIIYIRDQANYSKNFKSEYRFHITWCPTLSTKEANGTFEKYVVSTRTDGKFKVNVMGNNGIESTFKDLMVCKNCLNKLDYHGYKSATKSQKEKIFQNFKIADFLKEYKNDISSEIMQKPTYNEKTAPLNVYSPRWGDISKNLKGRKNYCEECHKIFKNDTIVHVHHINGLKSDNAPSNLAVLCLDCHKKHHNHMKGLSYKK
jgi:hypothetical protein